MTLPAAPTSTDIEVIQGATFKMRVAWTDEASPPQPISLADYFAHMQIRSKVGGTGLILAELSSTDGGPDLVVEPGGSTGVIDVRIPATVTAGLKKKCFYDLFAVNKTDPTDATRLVFGAVAVSLSATVNP